MVEAMRPLDVLPCTAIRYASLTDICLLHLVPFVPVAPQSIKLTRPPLPMLTALSPVLFSGYWFHRALHQTEQERGVRGSQPRALEPGPGLRISHGAQGEGPQGGRKGAAGRQLGSRLLACPCDHR